MGALDSLATVGLNMALGQQAQSAASGQLKQERDRQIREIRLRDQEGERQEALLLRRRLAEERARAGAAGVGSSGGAADAILRGLVQESSAQDAARAEESAVQINELRRTTSTRQRRNLLDLAERWMGGGTPLGGSGRNLLD